MMSIVDILPFDIPENVGPNFRDSTFLAQVHKDVLNAHIGHEEELAERAARLARDLFPVIDENDIIIEPKIVSLDKKKYLGELDFDDRDVPKVTNDILEEYKKRRVINCMTQGSASNVNRSFHLEEYLDDMDEYLKKKMVILFNSHDANSQDIFSKISSDKSWKKKVQSRSKDSVLGGSAYGKVDVDFKNGKWTIIASAVIFPVLVHEIVKGLYEIIALDGLPEDKVFSKKVIDVADAMEYELEDSFFGKELYASVRDSLIDNFGDKIEGRPQIFEYFLQEIYRLSPSHFIDTITSFLTDDVDLIFVEKTLNEIEDDIQRDEKLGYL